MGTNSLLTPFEVMMAIWKRNFLLFRKHWAIALFWILIEPCLILAAMGYGLGGFVPQIQGVSYLEFFFPALICNTTMLVSFFECTYGNFTKLAHSKLYHTWLLAPMDTRQILGGEIFWASTKAMISVVGVIMVAGLFGAVGSFRILLALPVIFLTSVIFATFGMLITSLVRNYDQIIYPSSGLIVPLSLFSGTYFPLESMPRTLQFLSYLSPLTHAVAATRAIHQGHPGPQVIIHISCLILLFTILWRVTKRAFEGRLIK